MTKSNLDIKAERRQTGVLLGQLRTQVFNVTQQDLFDTRKMQIGRTMLSRTETGKRTPEPWDLIRYLKALEHIDRDKLRQALKTDPYTGIKPVVETAIQTIAETLGAIWGEEPDGFASELTTWFHQLFDE